VRVTEIGREGVCHQNRARAESVCTHASFIRREVEERQAEIARGRERGRGRRKGKTRTTAKRSRNRNNHR